MKVICTLENAWVTCEEWAKLHGMEFAPENSELMHFTRKHEAESQTVRLGYAVAAPVASARFLGVWFDRKLLWTAHTNQVKTKIATQKLALTKLTSYAWGCDLIRARLLYITVIRSCLAYGAAAWHTISEEPSGPVKRLINIQAGCLRTVCGAYKATPSSFNPHLNETANEYQRA